VCWGICTRLCYKLLTQSNSEGILKIGQYLVKLWARVRCVVFLTHGVESTIVVYWLLWPDMTMICRSFSNCESQSSGWACFFCFSFNSVFKTKNVSTFFPKSVSQLCFATFYSAFKLCVLWNNASDLSHLHMQNKIKINAEIKKMLSLILSLHLPYFSDSVYVT